MEPVPPSKSKLSRRRPNPERKPRQSASEAKENPSHPYDVMVISEAGSSGAAVEDPVYGRNFSAAAADIESRNVPEETDKKLAPIFTRNRDAKSEGTQRSSYKRKQHPKPKVITKSNVSLLTGEVPDKQDWELKAIESSSVSQCSTTKREKLTTPSGWREELSAPVRESCLEEIQESNPTFPVRQIFAALRKKDERCVQLLESPGSENSSILSLSRNPGGGKRKCPDDDSEGPERGPKRGRSSCGKSGAITAVSDSSPEPTPRRRDSAVVPGGGGQQPRRTRLSRTHRLRQRRQTESGGPGLAGGAGAVPDQPNLPECDIGTQTCVRRDLIREDELWTDKYSPQHSGEVIGNSASVKTLHSWLRKWKLQADREERRRRELEKERQATSHDLWDCGDFQGESCVEEEGAERLCNAMLITGPPGSGKTASVYACARELGFKVFEVNASSQRSGRHVLTQLKEATLSHQVELQGHGPLRPTYLSYHGNASAKSDSSPGNTCPPRKAVSSLRAGPGRRPRRAGRKTKGGQAFVALANFFKIKSKAESVVVDAFSTNKQDGQTSAVNNPSTDADEEPPTGARGTRPATSLILFEEVDVVFDVDVGFLSAIRTFMSNTKRPVILTANDPSFSATFDCSFEQIFFKTPSTANVCSYLRLVCLSEGAVTEARDIAALLRTTRGDVRRSLLQLQFWVRGGGGGGGGAPSGDGNPASRLPSCALGTLGLLDAGRSVQDVLSRSSWAEPDVPGLMDVVAESWKRGVPLLYSNLELLLLPPSAKATPASVCSPEEEAAETPKGPKPLDSSARSQSPEPGQTDPTGTTSRLSEKTPGSAIQSLKPKRTTSLSLKKIRSRAVSSDVAPKNERPVYGCLGALADFMDVMSFLDATLPGPDLHTAGPCRPGAFVWTGAQLKDGLLDEMGDEHHGSCSSSSSGGGGGWVRGKSAEIRAALEVLGFRKLPGAWADPAWGGARELGAEQRGAVMADLPVPPHRRRLGFIQTSICEPSVVQRRRDVIRTVLASRTFSAPGDKRAVTVDYLPFLRSICQSERSQGRVRGRFPHYFSSVRLGLPKATVRLLAEDFP